MRIADAGADIRRAELRVDDGGTDGGEAGDPGVLPDGAHGEALRLVVGDRGGGVEAAEQFVDLGDQGGIGGGARGQRQGGDADRDSGRTQLGVCQAARGGVDVLQRG